MVSTVIAGVIAGVSEVTSDAGSWILHDVDSGLE
jgi:hypothetical protein